MSDDAYIPPSERRIASEESLTVPCGCGSCLSCEFGYGTKTIHRRLTIDDHGLLASHAVMDSIARDAERDQIANWLRTCNPSKTAPHLAGCFGSADKLADAIRNNEHRKGDQ